MNCFSQLWRLNYVVSWKGKFIEETFHKKGEPHPEWGIVACESIKAPFGIYLSYDFLNFPYRLKISRELLINTINWLIN